MCPDPGHTCFRATGKVVPRAPRRCPGDGYQCPKTITTGKYCADHTQAWKGPRTASSHATTQSAWPAIRDYVLERDGHQCRIQYPDICIGYATVVDKVQPAARRPDLVHDERNLRAACEPCNDHKARTEDRRRP